MNGFNLSQWALQHRALVIYFMIALTALGAYSYVGLGRDEDPAFTIRMMVVRVLWPGATTQETIDQVTDRVEKALQQTPGLDYLRSFTKPGDTTIYVALNDSVTSDQVPGVWYQVRKKIDDIRSNLPQGVVGPYFNDEFGDTFGIIYGFTSDGFSDRELRDHVEAIRARLTALKGVAKAELIGAREETVFLEFSPARLAGLGVDGQAVIASLKAQNAIAPAGKVVSGDENVLVRVTGGFSSEEAIEAINIRVGDRFVRLADLVTVRRGYADPAGPTFRVNGQPAIGLAISMAKGGNILELGEAVDHEMKAIIADLPIGIESHLVANQPHVVEEAVGGFTKALFEAVAIVLAVSFISLGLRAGLVVALSIPLVLSITFFAMSIFGIDLQRISLGALIIALGLLVDDAMITVEMMIAKLEEGFDKIRAATYAYTATAFPMLTGTLVTAAGFVPVGFATSGAGEYTFSLFQVITIALLISWVVAVIFSPYLGVLLLKEKVKSGAHATENPRLRRLLEYCLHNRLKVIVGTLAIFVLSLFGMTLVEQQFFPSSDRPELLVDMTLPRMASIDATTKEVDRLEAILKADPDIERWSMSVGEGARRFYLALDVQPQNDNFAQAVVISKSFEARSRIKQRLEAAFASDFPNVIGRVNPLEQGPPTGWPIKYRVSGPNPGKVQEIAGRLAKIVGEHPKARLVNLDWNEMAKVIRVKIDQDKARLLGLSSETISNGLYTIFSGQELTDLRDSTYLIPVVARAQSDERNAVETLRNLQVPLRGEGFVPLEQIASFEYALEYPVIWRRNRVPTATVQSAIAEGIQPATVVGELTPKVDELIAGLPSGYTIAIGGSVEDSAKGSGPVMAVVPAALFLTLTILMIQLQSFSRLFLVVSVAPLGLIGVAAALLIFRAPLGFIALLGVLALAGMIIRNSLILVTQIDHEIAAGHHPWEAIIRATLHRVRPILLTAAAAILGMIPIASEVFWGPMAFAIMGGLAVGTILTLLFLPALYALCFRIQEPGTAGSPTLTGKEQLA